jgi:LacI family transcriptional regulator
MAVPGNLLIALLISPANWGNRQLLQGITSYARQHAQWRFVLQEVTADGTVDKWLLRARPAGVIAEITSRGMARTLRRLGVPIVDVLEEHPVPHVPQIVCDDRNIVRRAVDHLRAKGLQHLAFVGDRDLHFAMQRRAWFAEFVPAVSRRRRAAGGASRAASPVAMMPASALLPEGLAQLAEWLMSLPRPVGVIACNDEWGSQVLRACCEHGLHVPDDVAVVGVGDDPIYCHMSDPPLSSIDCHAPAIGYEAAAMLDRLISGGPAPPPISFVDPGAVQERGSTDVLAIRDEQAVAAVRFLRTHACAGITPATAATKLGISRRTLERLFTRHVGHSPAAEISRVRLERARELLAETDLPLGTIARRVGLTHVETLHRVFKKRFGATPGGYRLAAPAQPRNRGKRRRLRAGRRRRKPVQRARP